MYIKRVSGTSSCLHFCQLLLFIIGCAGQLLVFNNSTPAAPFQNVSTVTAATVEYVVYPGTATEARRLADDIEEIFVRDYVHTFRNAKNRVEFWIIQMTDSEHKELSSRNPNVRTQGKYFASLNIREH